MDSSRPHSRIGRLPGRRLFSKTFLILMACTLLTAAGVRVAHAQKTPIGVASDLLDEALQQAENTSEPPASRPPGTLIVCGLALTAALGAGVILWWFSGTHRGLSSDDSEAERLRADPGHTEKAPTRSSSALREAVVRWGVAGLSTDTPATTPVLHVPRHLAEMVERATAQISDEAPGVVDPVEPPQEEPAGSYVGAVPFQWTVRPRLQREKPHRVG